jgi:hypothetical protein
MSQPSSKVNITTKGARLVLSSAYFDAINVTLKRAAELHADLNEKPLPKGHFLWNIREGCFRSYDARAIRLALNRHFKAPATKKRPARRLSLAA